MVKPHTGAYSQLWAATRPKAEVLNECIYLPVGKMGDGGLERKARNGKEIFAEKLWNWSEGVINDFERC